MESRLRDAGFRKPASKRNGGQLGGIQVVGWQYYHVESPPGTILATFREQSQALRWAHENISAGTVWVLRRWQVSSSIASVQVGAPDPQVGPPDPQTLPPVTSTPLSLTVHHLPGQGAYLSE